VGKLRFGGKKEPLLTAAQELKLEQLEHKLGKARGELPRMGESGGYVFTAVNGVTVLITQKSYNARGGYKLPAVRTYGEIIAPTNLDAAIQARRLFDKQTPDPDCVTGHLSPLIGTDWKCGNKTCPCFSESEDQLLKRAGVSRNS
jgi:hypothetical protein